MSEKYPLTPVSTARLLVESAWRRNDAAEDAFMAAPLVSENRTNFRAARAHLSWALGQLRIAERIEGVEPEVIDA